VTDAPDIRTVTAADGVELHLRHWPLPAPRGHVHIVHGLGEHVGRYERLAREILACGFSVSGHDHRGHGRSAGRRGVVAPGDSLCADLARVLDTVRAGVRGRFVLLGHSMGGLVASRFVAESLAPAPAAWSREVDALVLSSPALAADISAGNRVLLAVLGSLAPDLALNNGLQPDWVSRDPAVVKAYVEDALNHDRITPRLARFVVDGGELVRSRAASWRTPTLLMWAGADRCVAPRGSAEFARAAPPAVLQHQEFPSLAHEIFNEPERAQVVARLTRFLAAA